MKFALPAWLILLVLLPLLGVGAVVVGRLRRKQWAAFVAPRLRATLLKRGSPLPRWFALVFLLAACAALIGALARPCAEAGSRVEKSLGRNVLVAIDLSRSMRVADVKPDRLAQAKIVIYELLEAMPNERIGLIGFAGNAYEYAPLTVDHSAVRETVEQLDETWVPRGGSNLAEAVHLATETLKKTGQKNNALVIISDGDQNEGDLDDMIREARQSGVYILSIGVGTEDGDYVPNADFKDGRMVDRKGKPVISRLQADVMRKLAAETKGHYATAGSGADIPAMVKDAIKDLDAFEMEGRARAVSIEFYQWLLLPAILFLFAAIIAGTRWRGVTAAATIVGALILSPDPVRADEVSAAKQALEQERYPEARAAYRKLAETTHLAKRRPLYHLGEATAAYRGGDFNAARSAYSEALLSGDPTVVAESQLGMGNTLFQLGWKILEDNPYPSGSANLPDMARFDALVRERLAKLRESEQPAQGQSAASGPIGSLIRNWTDSIRHFDSILAPIPNHAAARNNRNLTLAYLKRLGELLEEDKQQTEESMPQSSPPPAEGEPKPDAPKEQPKNEPDDSKPPQPGEKGPTDDLPKKGGDDKEPKPDAEGKPKEDNQKDDKKDGKTPAKKPGESPEEQAKRILRENADLEKGPLAPGRHEIRNPEKDW